MRKKLAALLATLLLISTFGVYFATTVNGLYGNNEAADLEWQAFPTMPTEYEIGGLAGIDIDDETGYIYAVGYVENETGTRDAVFTKYSHDGSEVFTEIDDFSDGEYDRTNSISLTSDKNNVFISGSIREELWGSTFDIATWWNRDATTGEVIETHHLDPNTYLTSIFFSSSSDGENLYAAYWGYNMVTEEGEAGLIKYAADGSEIWKTTEVNITSQGLHINGDYVYMTGMYTEDGEKTEAFVSKYDTENGNQQWFKTISELGLDTEHDSMGIDVVTDSNNEVYFTVAYIREEEEDYYAKLVNLDADGNYIDKIVKDAGAGTISSLGRMDITNSDEIYITGAYDDTPVFFKFHDMQEEYMYDISADPEVNPVDPMYDGPSDISVLDGIITVVGSMDDIQLWVAQYSETDDPSDGYIEISPQDFTIEVGETLEYTAVLYDEGGNEIGDVTGVTNWSIEAEAGGSWLDNVYTSENIGNWTVTGEYDGMTDTAVLTVGAGSVEYVIISPSENQTITAGEELVFTAEARDGFGNLITDDVTTFVWENATDGVFNESTLGDYHVTATYDGVTSSATNVTVVKGFDISLTAGGEADGWNFVSFNLIPSDSTLVTILEDPDYGITGNYDRVMYYDASTDRWQSYVPGRAEHFNHLDTWNHRMGIWIRMTNDTTLTVEGYVPTSTDITLYPGWNMVGLPSNTAGNHGLPSEITRIGYFDATQEYNMDYDYNPANFTFEPGQGYMLYNGADYSVVWTVEY